MYIFLSRNHLQNFSDPFSIYGTYNSKNIIAPSIQLRNSTFFKEIYPLHPHKAILSPWWCINTGCLRDRERDWYYAKTIHTGCIWGQDWTPENHWNIIKTHHLKQFQDLKNGYITYSSLSLFRSLFLFRCSVKGSPWHHTTHYSWFRPQSRRQPVWIYHNPRNVATPFKYIDTFLLRLFILVRLCGVVLASIYQLFRLF